MAMIKEYFDIYTEKVQEYGEKTVILYQNGSFFEIFEKDEGYPESEKIGNAKILSEILQMKYTGKNLGKFINFIGFTKSVVDKYLPILLNEGYTIVIVNELETSSNKVGKGNLKRGITAIHSPSLSTVCTTETNLVGILLEITETQIKASFCCINNLTNDIELTEEMYNLQLNSKNLNSIFDELYRILYRYFPKELQVKILTSRHELIVNIETFLKEKYDSINIKIVQLCSIGDYKKETFQNEYFSNVYKHLKPGLLSYLEFLELNKLNVNSIMNFMYTLDFMGRHSLSYISNLNKPKIIKECNYLVLELNTLNQLNIINQHNKTQSLLHIIDFTKTIIGKRYLKNLLCKPLKDFKEIQSRYILSEELIKSKVNLSEFLEKICDFERLHRKMGLRELHPYEFEKLHKTYLVLILLIELIIKKSIFKFVLPNDKTIDVFKNYIKEYIKLFNLNEMKNHSLNSTKDTIVNYFNKGQIDSLDTIQIKIDSLETKRETLRLFYNNLLGIKGESNIKLEYTERDGYSFTCTKLRYTSLLSKLKEEDKKQLKLRNNVSNITKFYTDELIKLSGEILANRELLTNKIKLNYLETINVYYEKYTELFNTLKTFVEIIDITNSNYICIKKYNYTKPEIIESKIKTSFIQAKQLKHPIIESLGINYVPNDITLDDTKNGMLVFGVNSSGKCLGRNTKVIMFDGSRKLAKDIIIGDKLMGDELKTFRTVLSTTKGEGQMYRIIPSRGDEFICNAPHILSLKSSGYNSIQWDKKDNRYRVYWIFNHKLESKSFPIKNYKNKEICYLKATEFKESLSSDDGKIIDISVEDYLKKPIRWRQNYYLYRVPVDYNYKSIDIDAHLLGFWLGDGTSSNCVLTTADIEIIDYYKSLLYNKRRKIWR
jgi:DNA mismatch repair protein MutS